MEPQMDLVLEHAHSPDGRATNRHVGGARVLIVEDDPWISTVTRELLADEGFEATSASDGKRGLRLAERLRPDVVLLDVGLPRVDGGQLLQRLRAHNSLQNTPVIVISSRAGALNDTVVALANRVMRKPIDLTELIDAIRQAVSGEEDRYVSDVLQSLGSEAVR
jgi:DNA-binding response OmpR family regulator